MKVRLLMSAAFALAFCAGVAGGLWAQAFLLPVLAGHPLFSQMEFVREWNNRSTIIRETEEVVIRVDEAAEFVAERADGMTAAVEARGSAPRLSADRKGAGFVLASDGFIITTADAVPQGLRPFVYLKAGNEPFAGEVLKRDAAKNLAIVKIEERNLPTASFAPADSVRLGTPVVLAAKVVEAGELVRIVHQGIVRTEPDERAVRTSITDKDSLAGAPLFNLKGEIVGMSMFEASGRLVAIPVSALREFSGL